MSWLKNSVNQIWVAIVCVATPRCHEMTRLISQERERPHDPITGLRIKLHYKVCVWCERYRDQVGLISELSKNFPETAPPCYKLGEDAKKRIDEALKSKLSDKA
jgi:hypothetical protein